MWLVLGSLIFWKCMNYCEGANFFISKESVDRNFLISTSNGLVQGRKGVTYNGTPFWTYQGIPYAQPPTGDLRFKSPVPTNGWNGVLDATKEKGSCVELYSDSHGISTWGEEDCLYLNIYSPRNPLDARTLLPVFVWIYGGAFMFGNSSSLFYGPDYLIEQNAIIVTFNYRIGLFGFLSTNDLSSPGNYGLKDQKLALEWIQKNIENFGGDKNRVTIAGQSAGSVSVIYHMLSTKSKSLFQMGIANSGSPLCSWSLKTDARQNAFDLGLAVGIRTKSTKQLVTQLRKVSVDKLKTASRLMVLVSLPQYFKYGFPFGPVIEPPHQDAFLTENPYQLMSSGKFTRVPIIIGMNTLETMLFWESLRIIRPFLSIYELSPGSITSPSMNVETFEDRRAVGQQIKEHYLPGKSFLDPDVLPALLEYTSDDQFVRPIAQTITLMYKYTPIYFYVFSYASEYGERGLKGIMEGKPITTRTSHLEEQFYVWKRISNDPPSGKDKVISDRLLKIYKNFMNTGNPTPIKEKELQNIIWPRIQSESHITYLNLSENLNLMENFRQEHLDFWKQLFSFGHGPYFTY